MQLLKEQNISTAPSPPSHSEFPLKKQNSRNEIPNLKILEDCHDLCLVGSEGALEDRDGPHEDLKNFLSLLEDGQQRRPPRERWVALGEHHQQPEYQHLFTRDKVKREGRGEADKRRGEGGGRCGHEMYENGNDDENGKIGI